MATPLNDDEVCPNCGEPLENGICVDPECEDSPYYDPGDDDSISEELGEEEDDPVIEFPTGEDSPDADD